MTKEMLIDRFIPGSTTSDEKICLPVRLDSSGETHCIAGDLNSASHYYIVDLQKKTSSFLNLNDIRNIFQDTHGKGFKALGISSMICDGVSAMALKILSDTGISVWKPVGDDVQENLDYFANNELMEFSASQVKTNSCTSNCGSCNTGCR